VEVEVRPEPEEPEAVLAAVRAVLSADGTPAAYRSLWRAAGILENVEDEEDRGAALRSRGGPDATRA